MISEIKFWWSIFFGPKFELAKALESTPETREATRERFEDIATSNRMPQELVDLEAWNLMEDQVIDYEKERKAIMKRIGEKQFRTIMESEGLWPARDATNPKGNNVQGHSERPAQRTGEGKKTK